MSFVSFEVQGRQSYGLWQSFGFYIEAPVDFLEKYADLKAVITADMLDQLQVATIARGHSVPTDEVRLLPVIPNPGKILCVGLNYKSHVAETKRSYSDYPAIFTRFSDTLLAHEDAMIRPKISSRFDYEGELAIIMGEGGSNISQADAFNHIAGYACFNDGSVRDWQRHTIQWTPGKNFPATGPFGPYMVNRRDISDVNALVLETRLNGEVMQQASLADLIFTIPVMIEYISKFTPLSPGDVIATGTPGGVGDRREPAVYMKAGDVVEVSITDLGTLRNTIVDAA